MREQLAHRDRLLAILGELGPVLRHSRVVIQPAARVSDCQGHRRQALGGRVDHDHRVPCPRLPGLTVPSPAPEVDDLLAPGISATRAAKFCAVTEVLLKCRPYGFKSWTDVSLYYLCRNAEHGCLPACHEWEPQRPVGFSTA